MIEFESESKVQKATVNLARKLGMKAAKYRNENRRSAPDYIFFYQGLCFFIEFKATGKEASKAQLKEHEDYRSKGMHVFVVDCTEYGECVIRNCAQYIARHHHLVDIDQWITDHQ